MLASRRGSLQIDPDSLRISGFVSCRVPSDASQQPSRRLAGEIDSVGIDLFDNRRSLSEEHRDALLRNLHDAGLVSGPAVNAVREILDLAAPLTIGTHFGGAHQENVDIARGISVAAPCQGPSLPQQAGIQGRTPSLPRSVATGDAERKVPASTTPIRDAAGKACWRRLSAVQPRWGSAARPHPWRRDPAAATATIRLRSGWRAPRRRSLRDAGSRQRRRRPAP